MKKHLVVNILVSLAFIISGPLLDKCSDWADSFSLGAEMVLGMLTPLLFGFFVDFGIRWQRRQPIVYTWTKLNLFVEA